MSRFSDDYRTELDALRFSPAEKDRLAARLRAAQVEAADVEPSAAALPAPRRRRFARAAVVAAAALVLGVGGAVASATGTLGAAADYVADLFSVGPSQDEVVDRVGYPLDASASSGGVTVTAEAVVGDRHNCVVIFSLEREGGEAFEGVEQRSGGRLNLAFETAEERLLLGDGFGYICRSWFYDADPADTSIQYVMEFQVSSDDGAAAPEHVVGRTLSVHLKDLVTLDEGAERAGVLAEGAWDLVFELGYVDTTVELGAGQGATYAGVDLTVNSIEVSSLGLTVSYSSRRSRPIDVPIRVTFADGSTLGDELASGWSGDDVGDGSAYTKALTFDRIVDVDDIASVTVGDTTFELP